MRGPEHLAAPRIDHRDMQAPLAAIAHVHQQRVARAGMQQLDLHDREVVGHHAATRPGGDIDHRQRLPLVLEAAGTVQPGDRDQPAVAQGPGPHRAVGDHQRIAASQPHHGGAGAEGGGVPLHGDRRRAGAWARWERSEVRGHHRHRRGPFDGGRGGGTVGTGCGACLTPTSAGGRQHGRTGHEARTREGSDAGRNGRHHVTGSGTVAIGARQ